MPGLRYLIAYTPPPESPLARFGAGVLGYDCHDGVEVPYKAVGGLQPAILRLMTVGPRRVGFHASFMAPFGLGKLSEDELVTALGQFARDHRVVPVGPLAVAADRVHVVLRPVASSAQLEELAAACQATFFPLGAERASADAAANWSQFSMTLAEQVTGADLQVVADALARAFAPMADNHFELDAISLLRKDNGQRFRVVERWRLTGR